MKQPSRKKLQEFFSLDIFQSIFKADSNEVISLFYEKLSEPLKPFNQIIAKRKDVETLFLYVTNGYFDTYYYTDEAIIMEGYLAIKGTVKVNLKMSFTGEIKLTSHIDGIKIKDTTLVYDKINELGYELLES